MKRLHLALVTSWLALSVTSAISAATTTLDFNAPVPGTISDTNGLGTGFTNRLPGTGGSLPANDPNLNFIGSPGSLLVTSTHTDINHGGVNLGVAEAPGVFLPSVGISDFSISMKVDGIHVPNGSDQLFLYAGTVSNNLLRAGFHSGGAYPLVVNYAGTAFNDSQLGVTPTSAFTAGDDVILTLQRVSGAWSLRWNNLTNSAMSGSSAGFSLPWLNSANDLYVGVYAANAGTTTTQTNAIDYFSISVVPEPSSVVLFGLGAVGLFLAVWRRSRRRAG